jgi:hypothetical protein
MMKRIFSMALAFSICSFASAADSTGMVSPKKIFKTGYARLGISFPGTAPNVSQTAFDNFQNGTMGEGLGYRFDIGHIFYFLDRKQPRKVNVGLDWTILSLRYAKIDQWNNYQPKPGYTLEIDDLSMTVSANTKLGPVVAFNPIGKLVIEGRAQLTYGLNGMYFSLDEYDENYDSRQYFGTVAEEFGDVGLGFGSSFGVTARWGFIGLALDYSQSKLPVLYEAYEAGGEDISGSHKYPFKSLDLKLSFTF